MRTFKFQNTPNCDQSDPTNFPYWRSKDSLPPSANNGTPLLENNFNDLVYAILAVIDAAGLTPDENPETILSSQFLSAIQILQGEVSKIVVPAPDLDITKINYFCRFSDVCKSADFNNWMGVCESEGKLTLTGKVQVYVRNRSSSGGWTAPIGTNVLVGDPSDFGSGYVDKDFNNDNNDLLELNNVVGELTDEVIFPDNTSYILVSVMLKQKPMVSSGTGGYWTENAIAKTLTPSQVGITINALSSEWDEAQIKDKQRVVLSDKSVMFFDSATEELRIYHNIAINDSAQLVSIDGTNGVAYIIKRGVLEIKTYVGTVAGDPVTLRGEFKFTDNKELYTNSSIIVGKKQSGEPVDGEFWVNTNVLSQEEGIPYQINWHNDKRGIQGGQSGEYYHATENQWEFVRRLAYNSENPGTYPEHLWINENWMSIGNLIISNLPSNFVGFMVNSIHGLYYNALDKFIISAFCYTKSDNNMYSNGDIYYGMTMEFDGSSGTLTLRRSTETPTLLNQQLENENIVTANEQRLSVIRGINVAGQIGSPINGDIWKNSVSGKLQLQENNVVYDIINPGVNLSYNYRFSTSTTPPPSSGRTIYDNAVQLSSTKIYLSADDLGGSDVSNIISSFGAGSKMFVFDSSDSNIYHEWNITNVVDNGTYIEYDISPVSDSGDSFINNQNITIHFISASGGGGVDVIHFDAQKTGSNQTVSPSSYTKITFNSENYDDGGNYNPSTSRYTNGATVADGNFECSLRVTTAAAGVVSIWLRQNGNDVAGSSVEVTSANTFNVSVSKNCRLQNSDYIEVYMLQTTGFNATVNLGTDTRFCGSKINRS